MSQRRVLLISYYFPPLGGAGISRPRALFRHLTQFGYDCHVLTVKNVLYRVYEPELLEGLDSSKIFRSGSRDPSRLMYLLGARHVSTRTADKSRAITKLFFPDAKAGWIKPAINLAKKLCKKYRYDLIVSTSPPISAHLVAKELHSSLDIPWVADFTDFWVSRKAEDYFNSEQRVVQAKRLLREINEESDFVVAVNASCREYVGAENIIPNCYDSDFVDLWRLPASDEPFTIGVFGTISDLTPIEPLLKVLLQIREKQKNIFERIKVLQVGQVDVEWLNRQLSAYSLHEVFDVRQYQSRAAAIKLLAQSSVFYMGIAPDSGCGITPGRLYTLLASGRPILAYAPSGSEIDKVIAIDKSSFRFDDNTIDEARNFVCRQAERSLAGGHSFKIVPESVAQFSSEKMVEKFARLFDEVLGK